MFEIDVSAIEPVGEFGSQAWCEACAEYGVKMLEAAFLPENLEWAFSETYTHPPARFLEGGRELSGYYFMVKDGRVSGGDGVPDACRALSGFHVQLQWAAICNQSGSKYGPAGQRRRSEQEKVMFEEIEAYVGRSNPLGLGGGPKAVWPKEVVAALSVGMQDGGGLHNIAAALQSPSPEFADLPTTDMGVPLFSSMTEDQKRFFLELCGVAV
ncbi:MAG: hypothetical protein ACFHXK_10130 [bacterium]